jgi:hypothetical protein
MCSLNIYEGGKTNFAAALFFWLQNVKVYRRIMDIHSIIRGHYLKILSAIILILTSFTNIYAMQSTIVEAEGYACMGDDKSRKQTE